jgi:hypothetical protein
MVISPISNVNYEKANQKIADWVRCWPDKCFGLAKQASKAEGQYFCDVDSRSGD